MADKVTETIYNHKPSDHELSIFKLHNIEEDSYLRKTSRLKRLSDLHLLFLIRNDEENRNKVLHKIKTIKNSGKLSLSF